MGRRFSALALFFAVLVALGACGTGSRGADIAAEAQRLANDKTATAELNRINALLAANRPVTRVDLDSLIRLRDQYPSTPAVRQLLQGAFIKREDWAAAEKIIAETPDGQKTNGDRINLARIFFKQGKFREAEDLLKSMSPTPAERVDVVALLGQSQFYSGSLDEARASLESVRTELEGQKRADDLAVLGMIYYRQSDYPKALEVLQRAVDLAPENVSANSGLGRVYVAMGDMGKAEALRAKVQAINEKKAGVEKKRSRVVELYYQLEDAYAAKDLEKVITIARQIEPEADDATKRTLYQYLAAAFDAQGKRTEADAARAEAAKLTAK